MGEEGIIPRKQYIADRLVEFRKNKGLSTVEVARLAGITQSTLWRYENAQFAKLDVLTLVKVAKVLGVGMDQLTGTFNNDVENSPAGLALAAN